jgi:hypothetical protein
MIRYLWIWIAACMGAVAMSLSGCAVLSLVTYDDDKILDQDEFPLGEYFDMHYQEHIVFEPTPEYIRSTVVGSYSSSEIRIYQLGSFKGFCSRIEELSDEISSELEFEHGEELARFKGSIIRPWSFGAYEQFDDAIVLYMPVDTEVEQSAKKLDLSLLKLTSEGEITKSEEAEASALLLAESSDRLELVMHELLKTNKVIPIPLFPVSVNEKWPEDASQQQIRELVRAKYPNLMDRLEEIEEAQDAFDD